MPPAFHTQQVLGGNLGALGSLGADAGTTTTEPKSGSSRLWVSLAFFGIVGAFVYAVTQNDRESQRTASNPAGEKPRFFVALYGPWLRIDVAAPGWTKADYDAAHNRIFDVAKTAVGGNVTRRGRWLRLPASDADIAMDAVVDSLRAQGMGLVGTNIADLDDLMVEDARGNERAASVTEAMDAYDEDNPEEYASNLYEGVGDTQHGCSACGTTSGEHDEDCPFGPEPDESHENPSHDQEEIVATIDFRGHEYVAELAPTSKQVWVSEIGHGLVGRGKWIKRGGAHIDPHSPISGSVAGDWKASVEIYGLLSAELRRKLGA